MNAVTPTTRSADHVDAHVGLRVRVRRRELGITQQQLADMSGVSFQQIQKYENGANRISASRLVQLADALESPVAWFFEDREFARTHTGYRASVWSQTLAELAEVGGLELARELIALTPAQIGLMTKLAAEMRKGNKREGRQ